MVSTKAARPGMNGEYSDVRTNWVKTWSCFAILTVTGEVWLRQHKRMLLPQLLLALFVSILGSVCQASSTPSGQETPANPWPALKEAHLEYVAVSGISDVHCHRVERYLRRSGVKWRASRTVMPWDATKRAKEAASIIWITGCSRQRDSNCAN